MKGDNCPRTECNNAPRPWRIGLWLAGGTALAAGMWLCVWARVNGHASCDTLILASVAMGAVYLSMLALKPIRTPRGVAIAIILLAVLMRLPWFFMPVSVGEDHCRYLWDGAVTAAGVNPYTHAPKQVLDGQVDDAAVNRLARSGRGVLDGINHPHLRTIYPPVAQGAFALAYWIAPFNLNAWRMVLLAFDISAALAIVGLLRSARLPLSLAVLYLWNPLLVTEIYGGCHLDLIAAAMVAVFAWALVAKRPIVATVAVTLAIGAKLWPVLLLPFLLRSLWGKWKQMGVSAAIFAVMVLGMAIPFAGAFGASGDSGLLTYARIWSGRSGAYMAFDKLGWWLRGYLALDIDGHYIGRGLMMAALGPVVLWLGLRRASNPRVLCRRMAMVILLMLLLMPVLWPWYYVAIIPLAVGASRRLGLLLWTALLPLCYLESAGLSAMHLLWLVHVPVWLVLLAELILPGFTRRMDMGGSNA